MQASTVDIKLRRITTLLSIAIITFTLVAAITGVLLSFYYEPAAGRAYRSLEFISTAVPYGWLFRKIHDVAGNGVIVLGLVQIVAMFISRQFTRSWLTGWIGGIFLTLSAIGLGWTAMVLSWDQLGYWRFNIELGTISAIPLVGGLLRTILTGGDGISTLTVQHLYTLHSYLLSVLAIVFAIAHLGGIFWQERQMRNQMRNQLLSELAASTTSEDNTNIGTDMGNFSTNPEA